MLEAIAIEVEQLAGVIDSHRTHVSPLVSEVLAVIGGSSQRADVDMADLLRAAVSSLDLAVGSLRAAARETRNSAFAQPAGGYSDFGY